MGALSNTNEVWLKERETADGKKQSVMQRLFGRLDAMYPKRWGAQFGTKEAIANWAEVWAEAFVDEGITPQDIARGLKVCRSTYDWPPSLPEFLKACRPALDMEARFHVAAQQLAARRARKAQNWPDAQTFWAAVQLGDDLLNQPYAQMKGRWAAAWHAAEVDARKPIPDVAPEDALPAPGQTHDAEHAKARIRGLVEMLAGRMKAA